MRISTSTIKHVVNTNVVICDFCGKKFEYEGYHNTDIDRCTMCGKDVCKECQTTIPSFDCEQLYPQYCDGKLTSMLIINSFYDYVFCPDCYAEHGDKLWLLRLDVVSAGWAYVTAKKRFMEAMRIEVPVKKDGEIVERDLS